MKTFYFQSALIVSVLFLLVGCSSDRSEQATVPTGVQNGFTFENKFYPINSLIVNDFNQSGNPDTAAGTIRLVFRSVTFEQVIGIAGYENAKVIYIDYPGTKLKASEVNQTSALEVYLKADCSDGHYTAEQFIFDQARETLRPATVKMVINSITESEINVDFEFERIDGKILSGKYSGKFIQ